MKKKLLIISIVFISLFVLGGCKKITEAGKESFKELQYVEPTGYKDKQEFDLGGDNLTRNYWFPEDDQKGIQLFFYPKKDFSFLLDESDKYEEKEINGTTWRVVNDTLSGLNYDSYSTVYENNLYVIELDCIDKYPELSDFMKNVSFK